MTTSGDKRFALLSGPFPAVENVIVSEEWHTIRLNGGSGVRPSAPRRVIPAGPAPNFELLPKPASRWQSFTTSLITQVAGLLVLSVLSLFIPKTLPDLEYETTALLPPQMLTLRADPAPAPPPVAKPAPRKIEVVEKFVKLRTPKLVAPAPRLLPAPEVKAALPPMPVAETQRPLRPLPEVHTGVLAATNVPLPEVKLPASKIQTGGFGNPLGQTGEAKPGRLVVDRAGSFDLPVGSGLGNGTAGSKGVPGVVANAGFGKATGTERVTPASVTGSGVRTGGFSDAREVSGASRKAAESAGPAIVPVEILAKPKPVYTEEARRLRKEGEVLLEVVFTAGGEVRVLRVIQGLGYGLDEAAIAAAKQVRFRPAQSAGHSVDSAAKLHILFQLAY